jgi:hypothetical protein
VALLHIMNFPVSDFPSTECLQMAARLRLND